MQLKKADIILSSPTGITVWFMRLFQQDPVSWGHTLIAVDEDSLIEAKKGVKLVPSYEWFNTHRHFKIVRLMSLQESEADEILRIISEKVGLGYGWTRYIFQFLDHITFSNYFTRKFSSEDEQICSSLIAWGFWETLRMKFNGVKWQSCDPDDIDDESQNNPNFVVVKEVK